MKFLPVGIQDFQTIRTGNFVYVDKTRFLFEMVHPPQGFYFLSRPRRFGKSLTVSTLKCLFEGKRELFDGLWIAENGEWAWKEHPTILLDFNQISHDSPENLERGLIRRLESIARSRGLESDAPLVKERFAELILALRQKTGMSVAVLIDEYDKPLIDHLGKGNAGLEIAKANRDFLKPFLGVLKGGDVSAALRFVFVTGVTKFSRVSIFSDLNNLNDLSLQRNYADLLGYTPEELETDFAEHIRDFARETGKSPEAVIEGLRRQYNGYRFSEKDIRVCNPFSVLRSLKERAFGNYWFETGTPSFLIHLLRERNYPLPRIENLQTDEIQFGAFELENPKPEAVLFQTGYVTIKDVSDSIHTFDYPNREVKNAFLKHLFSSYLDEPGTYSRILRLAAHLRRESPDDFFAEMTAIFASIPYALETKRDEAYFHTIFYLAVSASGADARSEVLTCEGRIDLLVEFPETVFVFEFKCNQNADTAIRQIRQKDYAAPHRASGKKIVLVGIDFDTGKRNISEWKWEAD
jgi:hypothetical protein